MDLYNPQLFEERWSRFELRIRMKLTPLLQKGNVSLAAANMALRQAAENWFTRYDADGKWLCDISDDKPDRAALITEILKRDLCFSVQVKDADLSKMALYGIPVLSGVVGLGISSWLQWTVLAKVAATLLPSALSYPMAASLSKGAGEKSIADAVTIYIGQLDRYKAAILSALTEGGI